jgi:hypothetical protein
MKKIDYKKNKVQLIKKITHQTRKPRQFALP